MTQRRDESEFLFGFLMSLRAEGAEHIKTIEDQHHRRFRAVAEHSSEISEIFGNRILFGRSPFTDRYPELDQAILELWGRYTAHTYGHNYVVYILTREKASEILEKHFSASEILFLRSMARLWIDADQIVAYQQGRAYS